MTFPKKAIGCSNSSCRTPIRHLLPISTAGDPGSSLTLRPGWRFYWKRYCYFNNFMLNSE